jgi:hypothetical protein
MDNQPSEPAPVAFDTADPGVAGSKGDMASFQPIGDAELIGVSAAGGGLMQLVAYNAQDVYLTGNLETEDFGPDAVKTKGA